MSNNNSEEQTFRLGELVSLLNFNGAIINNNNYILLIDFIFTVKYAHKNGQTDCRMHNIQKNVYLYFTSMYVCGMIKAQNKKINKSKQ